MLDAATAAASAWYSPMDAAAAATAAAVQRADSKKFTEIELDYLERQEELETQLSTRMDELSEPLGGL